jgi:hypothetical protein
MKRIFFSVLFLLAAVNLVAQVSKVDQLQNLEKSKSQENRTATMKSAGRLFGAKDDLTTVIEVIPSGSAVTILDSDSTYYKVSYNDDQGYIFKRDAVIDNADLHDLKAARNMVSQNQNELASDKPVENSSLASKRSYLINKYGDSMAKLLLAGKIWKGMTGDMVRDSWGAPVKISKTYEGNTVKEEWDYNKTWLYLENDSLTDWGPIKNQ